MAELGLNIFQVIQNELIAKEGSRSTLGIGFRLSIIEERLKNQEARAKNALIWKPYHAVMPITALTPKARNLAEAQKRKLMSRRDANPIKDDKDPSKLVREEELWEVHRDFPRTILEFKELQLHPDWIRSLLDFYQVKVYRPDFKLVDIDPDDRCVDIQRNMETCLEELATSWGLNWFRIGGLALPGHPMPLSPR